MAEIPRISLVDTLHVIQLARETALANGDLEQAERFALVVDDIKNLIDQLKHSVYTDGIRNGALGQEDFRHMLYAAQTRPAGQPLHLSQNTEERNLMIQSMASSEMTSLEIARQMKITVDEVNLVLSINERGQRDKEIF